MMPLEAFELRDHRLAARDQCVLTSVRESAGSEDLCKPPIAAASSSEPEDTAAIMA
jgi:hypothetical protein